MKEFKIGNRVKAIKSYDGNEKIVNKYGTVIYVDSDDRYDRCDIGVQFDKQINGHTCEGNGKSGHCWWCKSDVLEHITNEQIIIYRKDNEVIALDKSTGKKGVAKCNPEDDFDFMVGAKLAFDRLSVREVKRPAKPGEYIKIVKPFLERDYGKGDILKVRKHMDERLGLEAYVRVYGIEVKILDKEYVVLEGYKPVEEDTTIKVGDNVKIIDGGLMYTTYTGWIMDNVVDKELCVKYAYDRNPYWKNECHVKNEDVFIVRVVEGSKLYIQCNNGDDESCYLIDIKGVEKC